MNHSIKQEQQSGRIPKIKNNPQFRIKSVSREKFLLAGEILTSRSRRKSCQDETKRIFSESKGKKKGHIESCTKVRLSRQDFERRLKKEKPREEVVYDCVRTEEVSMNQTKPSMDPLHTINNEENIKALQKIAKMCDPTRILSRDRLDDFKKVTLDAHRMKKQRPSEKEPKEQKGKYRCRVNQYIFDHNRKKSNHGAKDQQTIDDFWKQVNESMILPGNEHEEMSKDLRQFVDRFTTE